MNKPKWYFRAIDNGGKKHAYHYTAKDKTEAINKGFEKTRKNAKGDINAWECELDKTSL